MKEKMDDVVVFADENGILRTELFDLDYEYDAPRWFDLAQDEAPAEAAAAELWFATAPSYPPSRLRILQDNSSPSSPVHECEMLRMQDLSQMA